MDTEATLEDLPTRVTVRMRVRVRARVKVRMKMRIGIVRARVGVMRLWRYG